MTTLVAALVLASALMHASWNAAVKGRSGDPLVSSTALALAWAILGIPLLFVIAPPELAALPYLIGSVAVHVVYFTLLVVAYREGDLSFVYTIARGLPPLLVGLAALFIANEEPTIVGWAGIALVTSGVCWLGLAKAGAPSRRVLVLSLSIALCIATYTMLDGLGVRVAANTASYILWLLTVQGALFATGALLFKGRSLAREVWSRRYLGLGLGVLSALGYAVALWAMSQAPIGLVAALRETGVLFAALIGAFALREPFGRHRIPAAILIASGAVCIRFAG